MKCVFLVIDHYITTIFIKLVEDLSAFSPLLFSEQSLHVIQIFCSPPRKPPGLPDVLCVHVSVYRWIFLFKLGIWFLLLQICWQKKLISSQSKKEVENFICSNLRIITWRQDRQPFRTVLPLEVRRQLLLLRQRVICQVSTDSSHNPGLHVQSEKWDILIPYKIISWCRSD